jgi:hypothetical protein
MEKINFEAELEKFITCVKCRMVVTDPQESCCCGTLYCQDCSKLTPACLVCKSPCKFRDNSFVKRILNQMLIKCSFNCGQRFAYQDIKIHMSACELRQYNCNICVSKELSFIGKKKELIKHIIECHEDDVIEINDKYTFIKKSMEKKDSRNQNGLDKDYMYNLDENYEYNPIEEYSYAEDEYPDYA